MNNSKLKTQIQKQVDDFLSELSFRYPSYSEADKTFTVDVLFDLYVENLIRLKYDYLRTAPFQRSLLVLDEQVESFRRKFIYELDKIKC